ncbi:hypothetical protein ACFSSC_00400 [Corynebacterium mendelii]|uniref:Uncharacterized protein n=1 Tax=Corynebacterium mendelii TaxID=2765362 RepID=A0A939IV06_9CORY|nr:hypothetical protein [Corynebacterium mendelii]MBN9643746.1 hypothetical protein [Corynebacterium mendelii]
MKRFDQKARHRAAVSTLTAAPVVLFAVLALIASIAFVGITARDSADAYIPADEYTQNGTGGKPKVTAVMTKPSVYKEDVKAVAGEENTFTVDYEGSVTFEGIEKNAGGEYTVIATASSKAPFIPDTSQLVVNEPENSSIEITEDAKQSNNTVKVYKISGVNDGTVSVKFTGTGKYGPDSGVTPKKATLIYGTINGNFVPSKDISLTKKEAKIWEKGKTEPEDRFSNPNVQSSCIANTKTKWELPKGGYLMDLKFADRTGGGIKFTKTASQILSEPDELNKIEISTEALDKATALNDDSTKPFYGDADPIVKEYPDARWVDSINWKYNPDVNTGEVWLKPGSTVTVYRQLTYTNCPNGEADRSNAYIASLEIGKNAVPIGDAAQTSIVTQGKYEKPKACEDLSFIEGGESDKGPINPGGNHYGQLISDPDNDNTFIRKNLGLLTKKSDAIAESDKTWLKGKIFYLEDHGQTDTLKYIDLSDPRHPQVEYSSEQPSVKEGTLGGENKNIPLAIDGNIAFDKDGVLWTFAHKGNELYLFSMNVAENATSWKSHGHVAGAGGGISAGANGRYGAKDLVFNEQGDLYWVHAPQGSKSAIYKIPGEKVRKADEDTVFRRANSVWKGDIESFGDIVMKGGAEQNDRIYGLAWGPDGKLYAGSSTGNLYRLEGLDTSSQEVSAYKMTQKKAEKNQRNFYAIGDMSSCSFGTPKEPTQTEFRVEKRAVDPKDGSVGKPGTQDKPVSTVKNKVDFTNGNQGTVRFVVTVSNVGNKAGTPGSLTDTVTIPNGFEAIGYRVTKNGSVTTEGTPAGTRFKIPLEKEGNNSGELKPQESVDYSIALDLKITDLQVVKEENKLECSETDTSGGAGFFNHVDLEGENESQKYDNDACVPGKIPPTAQLKLVKKIVDHEGKVVATGEGDATAFHLAASSIGDPSNSGGGGADSNRQSITAGVSAGISGDGKAPVEKEFATVAVGRYQLSETVADNQSEKAKKYRPFKNWACKNDGKVLTVGANGIVDVPEGGKVACEIVNAASQVKIQKFAFNPTEKSLVHLGDKTAGHAGKIVYLDGPHKSGVLEYLIVVDSLNTTTVPDTNIPTAINTGAIRERFELPDGLLWDYETNDKGELDKDSPLKATVTIAGRIPESTKVSFPRIRGVGESLWDESNKELTFTEKQLKAESGVTLTPGIQGLKKGQFVKFKVTIPVRADDSDPDEGGLTKFDKNAARLGKCTIDGASETKGQNDTKVVSDDSSGVINTVYLFDENENYSPNWRKDNVACVPVRLKKPYIRKNAFVPEDGLPHVGQAVELTKTSGEKPEFRNTLVYSIDVTWGEEDDSGTLTTGKVIDKFTMPDGLVPILDGEGALAEAGKVTVSIAKLPTGVVVSGWSEGELANGKSFSLAQTDDGRWKLDEELTASIKNLPANAPVQFKVEIPVAADMSPSNPEDTQSISKYESKKFDLAECMYASDENIQDGQNKIINDYAKGVINEVVLENEDQHYVVQKGIEELWRKDNVACIPVRLPGQWSVEKEAETFAVDENDVAKLGWENEGTPVKIAREGNTGKATAVYRITLENNGVNEQPFPGLTDEFVIPPGATVDPGSVEITEVDANGNPVEASDLVNGISKTVDASTLKIVLQPREERKIPAASNSEGSESTIPGNGSSQDENKVYFKVAVPVTIELNSEEWQQNNQLACQEGSEGSYTGGLPNKVTLNGGEQDDTSWACVPLEGDWKIRKLAKAAGETKEDGSRKVVWKKVGDTADNNAQGLTATYLIELTNTTGRKQTETPSFVDYAGASFLTEEQKDSDGLPDPGVQTPKVTMTMVYLGADKSAEGGKYVVGSATEGETVFAKHTVPSQLETIGSGESVFFRVVLTYTAAKTEAITDVIHDTCQENQKVTAKNLGIKNTVTMENDFDGESNNTACLPVTPGRKVLIQKTDANGTVLSANVTESMQFVICPADAMPQDSTICKEADRIDVGLVDTNGQNGENGLLISKKNLDVGKDYVLIETKAPKADGNGGFELLAQPLRFKLVGDNGIEILNGKAVDGVVSESASTSPSDPEMPDNTFIAQGLVPLNDNSAADGPKYSKITVRDPRAMTLPHSGGLGEWPFALGGMVLIGAALMLTTRKTSGVPVRS